MLELFLTFAKIGLFTFGGGYAMLALIEDICVDRKKWLTHEEMMDLTVVAESTPGPIAINCATYVGYRQRGFGGAVSATFGVVLPSFVILYLISRWLDGFLEITVIASAFRGIKLAVGLLILNAGINMAKKMKKTPLSRGILLCALAVPVTAQLLSRSFSSLLLMLLAGTFSLLLFLHQEKGGKA